MLSRLSASGQLPRLVFLGAGRVATHLAPALLAAGYPVSGVWSRTTAAASALAARLPGAVVLTSPAAAAALAPAVVLVCLPDAVVGAVIAAAQLPTTTIVAHTAGALPLPDHPRGGVFYPLQTFSAGRAVDLRAVPLCLEATDEATGVLLAAMAHRISDRVVWLDAAARARLHLAAVLAANFTNHLLGVSDLVLRAGATSHLPFDLLAPLVQEVVAKAFAAPAGPFSVQTGPAARHDTATLAAHRALLAAEANLRPWLPVYDELTAAIQRINSPDAGRAHPDA